MSARIQQQETRYPRSKFRQFGSLAMKGVFGVAGPLLCFGSLLFVSFDPGPWVDPAAAALAIYAVLCVTAFVASWIRAPRDDSIDAALHGVMLAAVLFAALWTLVMIPLTVFAVGLAIGMQDPAIAVLAPLGACAPIGFVVYYRALRERWPKRRATRGRLVARLAGGFVPMLTCAALWATLSACVESYPRVAID
jgi:hypothetical protein